MMRFLALLLISLRLLGTSWSVVCIKTEGFDITRSMVKNIYFKTLTRLNARRLLPLNLPASHPARQAFLHEVLGIGFETWDLYYDEMHFEGVAAPQVVPSVEAMKRYLFRVEGTVGYLPTQSVTEPMIEIIRFEE